MRNKRRTDEEWLSLIQQCRSSGFSDRVWCEQNDISVNPFYNTVTSRKGSCAQNFLEGFRGLVQCDGYQGYNKLEDVILVCCIAHARRKFFEAVPAARRKRLKLLDINSDEAIEDINLPDEEEAKQLLPAEIGLLYCNKLFYLERTLKDLNPEERKQQRDVLEQPVWDQFWNWLDTLYPTGGKRSYDI